MYNVFESELDLLSNYNNLSTAAFSFGSMFSYKAIDSLGDPFLDTYQWYLWFLFPCLIGIWLLYKRRGLIKAIKKKSVVIKIDVLQGKITPLLTGN